MKVIAVLSILVFALTAMAEGKQAEISGAVLDFNGNWTGRLMQGPRCESCSDVKAQEIFFQGMESTIPALSVYPVNPVNFKINMTSTEIILPRIELVYRGPTETNPPVLYEKFEINGNTLTASKAACEQVTYSIQPHYCPFKKGIIIGNTITIIDPRYRDEGLAIVQYILNSDGTLRYGSGFTEVRFEGQSAFFQTPIGHGLFRMERVDFQPQAH